MNSYRPDEDLDLVVEKKALIAEGIVSLTLRKAAAHSELPPWSPGAHIELVLPEGTVRQYSLCGDLDERNTWKIAVLREPKSRGGSAFIHDTLKHGDLIRVRGPRNNFLLDHDKHSYLFIAGGIGITPLLPMIQAVDALGRDWQLAYGGRSRTSMAFHDWLSEQYGDNVKLIPQDEEGVLPLEVLLSDPKRAIYCCGPGPLLDAVAEGCRDRPAGTLRVERFSPKAATRRRGGAGEFELELAASGVIIFVPENKSVLEAMVEAGVAIEYSCTEGICGTCETKVLGGRPEHRDSILTEDEQAANNTMFPCVSRSLTERLVIDR